MLVAPFHRVVVEDVANCRKVEAVAEEALEEFPLIVVLVGVALNANVSFQ